MGLEDQLGVMIIVSKIELLFKNAQKESLTEVRRMPNDSRSKGYLHKTSVVSLVVSLLKISLHSSKSEQDDHGDRGEGRR